jgi:hypothetical protein
VGQPLHPAMMPQPRRNCRDSDVVTLVDRHSLAHERLAAGLNNNQTLRCRFSSGASREANPLFFR